MRRSEVENILLDEMVIEDHIDLVSDNISEDTIFNDEWLDESIFDEDTDIEQYTDDNNSLF